MFPLLSVSRKLVSYLLTSLLDFRAEDIFITYNAPTQKRREVRVPDFPEAEVFELGRQNRLDILRVNGEDCPGTE